MQLPQFQSHKVVSAAKIVAIDHGERLDLMPHGVVEVGAEWIANRRAEAGGYYVLYEDGYTSYSPAKAFEEGYKPLAEATPAQPEIVGYRQLNVEEAALMNGLKLGLADAMQQALLDVGRHIAKQRHNARVADTGAELMRIDDAQPERWAAIARTHFQEGLMALTRAVAQPGSF